MKKVLVIGENSYISRSFEAFAKSRFEIKLISSRGEAWKSIDFSGYDSILHCAGIAHVKQTDKMKPLYYAINCDLAAAAARKAKLSAVRQFIFLSSMAVYGTAQSKIDKNTLPNPNKGDLYGISKLKAERELEKIAGGALKLCIVRPPMVYGQGCRGNFPKLVRLAELTPFFPGYPNKRSMIYIDNLCGFFCKAIDSESAGIFLPQNREYVNTSELVRYIAECQGRRIIMTKLFNPVICLLKKHLSVFEKLFGDLYYVKQDNINEYKNIDFEESVKLSIKK